MMTVTKARTLADTLLKQHGLDGWTVQFTLDLTYDGMCDYQAQTIRVSEWGLIFATQDDVAQTVLHEIAHALTPGEKHGPTWEARFEELKQQYFVPKRRRAWLKTWGVRAGLGTAFLLFCYWLPSLWQGWGALSPAAKDALSWYAAVAFMVGFLGLQCGIILHGFFGIFLYDLFRGNR